MLQPIVEETLADHRGQFQDVDFGRRHTRAKHCRGGTCRTRNQLRQRRPGQQLVVQFVHVARIAARNARDFVADVRRQGDGSRETSIANQQCNFGFGEGRQPMQRCTGAVPCRERLGQG